MFTQMQKEMKAGWVLKILVIIYADRELQGLLQQQYTFLNIFFK